MLELVIAQERLSHASAALGVGTGMLFNVIGELTAFPEALAAHVLTTIAREGGTLAAARALLYDTARRFDRHPELHAAFAPHVATAKYSVTHAACHATELALRVAGGFSLTRELTLERHFRDAHAGLFQPLRDDLALALVGRTLLSRVDG